MQASGLYVNRLKDSTWNYYNRDSVLVLEEKYTNGKLNGAVKTFYDEGQLYELKNYKDDVLVGIWKQYFLNGKIKLEGSYKEGKREGEQTYFFPNGEIYSSGVYRDDAKYGKWIYYTKEGIQDTVIRYNE